MSFANVITNVIVPAQFFVHETLFLMKSYSMMPKDRKKLKSKFRWWALIVYVSVTNKSPVLLSRESPPVWARVGPIQ